MNQAPIGTGQRVIVICVRYSDALTTRLPTASDWATLLDTQVNGLFRRATYNQTDFVFEVPSGGPANGWFDLGYPSTSYDYFRTGQDAINLADPHVNFADYNRVAIITSWPGFGGQGGGGYSWTVSEGIEFFAMIDGAMVGRRVMSLSICNEWVASSHGENGDAGAAVIAHELGHHLGLPTHYGDVRTNGTVRDSISAWDLMGFSPHQRHFLGWAKGERGWLGPARTHTVGPSPTDQTITLRPLEAVAASGTQLIKIPFATTPQFEGYVVENRQPIDGDEQLSDTGVLVSLVDESPEVVYGLKAIVMHNPGTPGSNDAAAFGVGETFQDPEYGIEVEVVRQTGNDYDVRVRYPLATANRPDPSITHWGAPPWETPDIWIDSQKNGWGTYRYSDASGNPTGNGDEPWLDHDNRVYVRVSNAGTRVATNVRVQVYVNQPPGMGDAGPDWQFIGSIVFPSIMPGTPASDYVIWRPTVGAHTCIRAVIDDSPGEVSTSNNRAQENVAVFESAMGSPWQPVETKFQVFSPSEEKPTEVILNVRDVPDGWAIHLEPERMVLQPGETGSVYFAAYPAGPPGFEEKTGWEKRYKPGFIGRPRVEALVPLADTYVPIGGIDAWVHLVERTKIDLKASTDGDAVVVDGSLAPFPATGTVAVELEGHSRKTEVIPAPVDEGGRFALRVPVQGGFDGRVRAYFAGDDNLGSSESEPVEVGRNKRS